MAINVNIIPGDRKRIPRRSSSGRRTAFMGMVPMIFPSTRIPSACFATDVTSMSSLLSGVKSFIELGRRRLIRQLDRRVGRRRDVEGVEGERYHAEKAGGRDDVGQPFLAQLFDGGVITGIAELRAREQFGDHVIDRLLRSSAGILVMPSSLIIYGRGPAGHF